MWQGMCMGLAKWLVPDFFKEAAIKEHALDEEVNRRVAAHIARVDPLQILLKEFHSIFSEEFERVEERLDEKGQLDMEMWGWTQMNDPRFNRMINWIVDSQANETFMHTPLTSAVTADRLHLWGKAQVLSAQLFKKEVGRLANLYQQRLERQKEGDFSSEVTVE